MQHSRTLTTTNNSQDILRMTNFLADLPQKVKDIAEKGNVATPEEVLMTPSAKLRLLEGCTEHDIGVLKEATAKILCQQTVPVADLLKEPWTKKWARLSFGCSSLDRCTRGGILTRGITEICGASGVGKTQLLLQLSLTVQLPVELGGLGKCVAYICTEDVFPTKRLLQMANSFEKRYPAHNINFLGNVYIEHVLESEDLLKCVCKRLAMLMASVNIGLVVIDSVAAVFRMQTNYIQRAQDMRRLASSLLRYADKYNCAIVCVNQVTTVSKEEPEVPCLGLAWSHLGRTRLRVSKVPKQLNINKQLYTIRKLEIMYSPESPCEFAEFLINEHGVVDVP